MSMKLYLPGRDKCGHMDGKDLESHKEDGPRAFTEWHLVDNCAMVPQLVEASHPLGSKIFSIFHDKQEITKLVFYRVEYLRKHLQNMVGIDSFCFLKQQNKL